MLLLRTAALLFLLLPAALSAAQSAPVRPKILGISHASFLVADMAKARAFYEGYLGYEPVVADSKLARFKVNDLQSIEVVLAPGITPTADRANNIALRVDDAEGMRAYLKSKNIDVPAQAAKDANGNLGFTVKDPQGNVIMFVQHLPDGRNSQSAGQHLSDRAISRRIMHVGVIAAQLDTAKKFYEDILGLREFWRGTAGPILSWVNLRVPDGDDYIEFMLYDTFPNVDRMRSFQHVCLEVADAAQAEITLKSRLLPEGCRPTSALRSGVNGKRQINTFDPDGTRTEVMEPNTFDGKPRPPSTAPAPVGEPRPPGR